MDIYDKISELYEKRRKVKHGGGEEKLNNQRDKGKLTARERLAYLLDKETFIELNPFMKKRTAPTNGDGVVTGYGKINGKPVYIMAHDFTVHGGTLGEIHGKK
ncbi:MAG: hypothetical protein ACFWT6_16595 [Virgibacillus proomii]|jgi:propionyl-CoA carboxylase beta chain